MANKYMLSSILSQFPPISCGIAYGSAVFKQSKSKEANMLDLIFAVDNIKEWHEENLKINTKHYSCIKYLGLDTISKVQDSAAAIYYNSDWPELKYGIISKHALVRDLTNWDTYYIAGRMQKPVLWLTESEDIKKANLVNIGHAFKVAMLLLPETFTISELFITICSLSYTGDIRTFLKWEDPFKVSNIVNNNFSHFCELYRPFIIHYLELVDKSSKDWVPSSKFRQNVSNNFKLPLLLAQPETVQTALKYYVPNIYDIELDSDGFKKSLKSTISDIVKKYSLKQALKGAVTSPFLSNFKYVARKIGKSFKTNN